MFDRSDLTGHTTDALEQRLVAAERLIARLRADQTRILRIIDARQVPSGDGYRSLGDWTAARLDVTPETSARLIRLATVRHHGIDRAVAAGEITFDRAVELTRLESDDPVADAAGYGLSRLRTVIASRRRHTRRRERDLFADRYLVIQPNLEESTLRLWGELVGVDSVRVEQILTHAADTMPALPDGQREPRRARLADALTNAVIDSATPTARTGAGRDPTGVASTQVTVFVDARAAAPTNGETGVQVMNGPRLGPQALEAVLCDAIVEVTALTTDGTVLAVGDGSATIPPRLHRYIRWRDQSCAADGCTSRYRLEVHHLRQRSHGGDHHPDNLVLLCWHHHHVVIHGHGYHIDPTSPPHQLRFHPPHPQPDP
jgi:hypothetical protein